MADAIASDLGAVLTRWTMGGSALPTAPPAWRDWLGGDVAEAELRLLALSGQYLGAMMLPLPGGAVQPLRDLPRLALPTLPDRHRPAARRLLARSDTARRQSVLDFVAARGWTMHPADWLPTAREPVPPVYAPWQAWVAAPDRPVDADAPLDGARWDQLAPLARRTAFVELRAHDPAAARVLLAEKIEGETAAHRVRLVEALADGLSDADHPLLERLAADRAGGVREQAALLLGRLGAAAVVDEDAAELAGFFRVETRGLLRRTQLLTARPLATPAQRRRRDALLGSVPFAAFAAALALPAEQIPALWSWGSDDGVDPLLCRMIARSAPEAVVFAATDGVIGADAPLATVNAALWALLPRLDRATRRRIVGALLTRHEAPFVTALSLIEGVGGTIDTVLDTRAAKTLFQAVRDPQSGDQADELHALGLIATPRAAGRAIDALAAAGLPPSDLRLDMLRFNAALDDRNPTR